MGKDVVRTLHTLDLKRSRIDVRGWMGVDIEDDGGKEGGKEKKMGWARRIK